MTFNKVKNLSYLFSIVIHLIILIIFMFIKFSSEPEEQEYVTIGFGTGGRISAPGAVGERLKNPSESASKEKQKQKSKVEEKKVELPETKNTETENVITKAKDKENKKDTPPEKVKPLKEEPSESKGKEVSGTGEGNFGFELDFGGKGIRKIYSYVLPEYPQGVSKEIDVKLKFTILPDGTVGRIIPLIKADARLEVAAMNSLRQWRFEPLPSDMKQVEQNAVITFPYRLQ